MWKSSNLLHFADISDMKFTGLLPWAYRDPDFAPHAFCFEIMHVPTGENFKGTSLNGEEGEDRRNFWELAGTFGNSPELLGTRRNFGRLAKRAKTIWELVGTLAD